MKEKNKITIAILVSLFIDILILWLLVVPAFRGISKASSSLLSYKKRLALIKGEIANFQDFETHRQLYLKNLQEMDNLVQEQLFIDKEIPSDLVNFCQKEALEKNLQLKITPLVISPQKEKERKPPFDFLDLSIKVEGSFPEFLRFLKRLENSPWLIEVRQVNISKQEEKINANLLIRGYVKARNNKKN